MDYKKRTSDSDVLIAEGAVVVGDVTLAKGVSVWYNAVIRGDEAPIEVGENRIFRTEPFSTPGQWWAPTARWGTAPSSMAAPWETTL